MTMYCTCIFPAFLLLIAACGCSSFITQPPPSVAHQRRTANLGHSFTNQRRSVQLNDAAVSVVETFFITKPYVAAFLTCSVKASAADLIAQIQQQQPSSSTPTCADNNVDLSRNLAFLVYGGLYQGMAQQFMYSTVFPGMFGHDLDMLGLARQVGFDMMVVGPFLCLPLAYAAKSLFSGGNEESSSGNNLENKQQALQQGLEKYMHDVTTQGLLLKYWGLWTPVNFLTFGVVPMHFRVAFVAFISFFWIFVLSTTSAAESTNESILMQRQARGQQKSCGTHDA